MNKWLASLVVPSRPKFAALLAVVCVLTMTSYFAGFSVDDHFHRLILHRPGTLEAIPTNPFDLFRFVPSDGPARARMFEVGVLPWWTSPRFTIAFFRPTSALFHQLDYALWPNSPFLMHVHSQLWLVLAVVCARKLYQRLSSPTCAFVATALFALDDAHGEAVGWLAGRNALIAGAFGLLAILAHILSTDRRTRAQRGVMAAVALGLYATSLSAGEIGTGALAYVVSHALFLDRRARAIRVLHVATYVAITIAWQALCRSHGYGAAGTDLYVDPWASPFKFGLHALARVPFLMSGQLAFPPADLWSFESGPVRAGIVIMGSLLLLLLYLHGRRALRENPQVRFWAVGALLSALPACAKIPSDRLLFFCGFGVFGYVVATWPEKAPSSIAERVVRILVLFGVVQSILLLPVRSFGLRWLETRMAHAIEALPQDDAIASQTLVILNSPHPFLNIAIPVWQASWDKQRAHDFLSLGLSNSPVYVTRVDASTLRVRPTHGYFGSAFDGILRERGEILPVGTRIRQAGGHVRISRLLDDGRPAEIEVSFDRDVNDIRYRFVTWRDGAFRETAPPSLGDTLMIPGASFDD